MSDGEFEGLHFPEAPKIVVKPPGPKSREMLQRQSLVETAAVSYPKALPMALEEGRGATLKDVDGNVYIDFLAGAGTVNVGHCNPEVVRAAKQQMEMLTHCLDFPTPVRMELTRELFPLLPGKLKSDAKIFIVAPTGADAVETAVKLAKFNTRRVGLVSFEGAYHGMTAGSLALTADTEFKKDYMPMMPEVHFVPYAYCYRCAFGKEYPDCDLECARYVRHVLEDPNSGVVDPAAIIVEAVQGEGGSIPPPEGFMAEIRRICADHSVPLIVDEIQAGMCRTGRVWACEHSGITPDIMTISKGIGGGLPLAMVAFDKNLDTWKKGAHVGTFRGNVVALAAAVATVRFVKEHKLWEHAASLGKEVFLPRLDELKEETEHIGDVRGKGLMVGVEFVKDRKSKKPWPEIAGEVRKTCYEMGLITEVGGHYQNVIRFIPPLVITKKLAETGLEIFAEATKRVESSKSR
ncbi:MAG: aspartate aminotransferase family protein [Candidatus Bathyarchaeia archaeon]